MQPNDVQPEAERPPEYGAAVAQEPDQYATEPQLAQEPPMQQQGPSQLPAIEPVSWQAPEYIQQEKTPLWYVGFFAATIVLIAAAIWLGSWTFVILIPVMAVALLMYTHRPPQTMNYVLTEKGLYINDRLHPLGEFKKFGVVDEHALHSLVLVPVKRFRPGLTAYFPTEAGEELVDFLGAYLPMEQIQPDAFDRIIRKLRI